MHEKGLSLAQKAKEMDIDTLEGLKRCQLFAGLTDEEIISLAHQVRYRVLRASAKELWGIEHNPTVAYVQPQMATLSLLQPKDAKASWHNESERTTTSKTFEVSKNRKKKQIFNKVFIFSSASADGLP